MRLSSWIKSGSPWIWLTGGAVSISLLSVLGLMLFIGWKGLTYFWPAPLYMWQTDQGARLVGQLYDQEWVPLSHLHSLDLPLTQEQIERGSIARLSVKIANRERNTSDFISILDIHLKDKTQPKDWAVVDRERNGQFYGRPVGYVLQDGSHAKDVDAAVAMGIEQAESIRQQIHLLITDKVAMLGHQVEQLQHEKRRKELNGQVTKKYLTEYELEKNQLDNELALTEQDIDDLRDKLGKQALIMEDMSGEQVQLPIGQILRFWYPNQMSLSEKIVHWAHGVWLFLSDDPRESNSEGGVFPAIFGTVLLVLLMSIVVMPLGIIAAVYLHEYAKDNAFTRLIRVAVINLAGVPSIVYGVFGLGFFVYTIGGTIDKWFFAENLPTPTFGTPGLLWSALTLAVLTLPVVIVATEEGLTRIPNSIRHGSLALGATQFETVWRIVLPMASPAMITGLILAIARAAGEVAPLMLVGVVKLASNLPVDNQFPYLHLERKFMHLGFHIYDLGFQTTNIEAARPLVYATAFLLVMVIVLLNLTAISIRNNLREKYRTLGQD
ncbi:phosphate ABC transporter permease PstA [Vibrio porteresiae]|uniref:Phosphate transport system permease protein PstA n=1 Tax=Vibrio porteresiae DSM 19223 TaxID=1123496 RepID=A0ABZ0QAU8_9VIBR|nr:phosphate ABC transporter permease PstA [Vibrio porteresiae]WPC73559.1 phosphate ABC transporter permease PstA [Vibrio porteresiae DSM 19223]